MKENFLNSQSRPLELLKQPPSWISFYEKSEASFKKGNHEKVCVYFETLRLSSREKQ